MAQFSGLADEPGVEGLATTMDDIADTAGVSKRTVYNHFIDKEALFREVVMAATGLAASGNTSQQNGHRQRAGSLQAGRLPPQTTY